MISGPVFTQADLLAPLAAVVAGVGAFALLHGLGLRARGGDRRVAGARCCWRVARRWGWARWRRRAAGCCSPAAWGPRAPTSPRCSAGRSTSSGPRPLPRAAAFPQLGTPTFLTANSEFYRIDTALRVPTLSADDWSLRVHGMVGRELTLRFEDLADRPLVERTITMTCVSNPIGGNLVSTANFVGVPLRDVLLEAGVAPGADQLFSTSSDGWYTGTPMATVLEPDRGALLAIGMNGEALPYEHGFPVRMVVPGLYGYVSGTKWLVDLEATTFADPEKQGYWLQRGWSQRGPIKTMTRIDNPVGFAQVAADTVTVAGIAWAQHTGIAKVEIRVDGGPWRATTLSDEVSVDTWRMWHAELALPPGSHSVEARATDKSGYAQTDQRADPIPDGATGWPSVRFTVT